MSSNLANRVNLGIIGCGAVTESRYLQSANLLSDLVVTHVADLNFERAKYVADWFKIPNFTKDYQDLFGRVDAVVVATPPSSHARISIDCMRQGIHVLCEKPLATSIDEAKEMVKVGNQMNVHLAVGMIRRLKSDFHVLKRLINADVLGNIKRFSVEEGSEFNWPLRTAHIFQKSGFGGVLADTGSHIFDLLFWIFDKRNVRVISYKDDNWGGVEANVTAEVVLGRNSQQVQGEIALSFTRALRNTIKIHGDKGWVEASTNSESEVMYYPENKNANPLILYSKDVRPRKKIEQFALQLSNFIDSIKNSTKKYVPAEEAIPTISVIEECYKLRRQLVQQWHSKHLESFFKGDLQNDC
jgi:predicted dehydrogenase